MDEITGIDFMVFSISEKTTKIGVLIFTDAS